MRWAKMYARTAWGLCVVLVAFSLLASLGFVVATLGVRLPYWGEAEVLFEASRLRAGWPIFTDPLRGASELGLPPSRFYVTYPPLWTWCVSWMPEAVAMLGGRTVSSAAWFGTLAWLAFTSAPSVRRSAILAASFVAGIWVLTNFASTGRPDSAACALGAITLARAVRHERLDGVGVALLVLVPWMKPTILGLPAGAMVAASFFTNEASLRRREVLSYAAALVALSALFAHVGSSGELFRHVVRSNAQPFTMDAWMAQVPARLPFFAPLFAWAGWVGWRERERAGMAIVLGAFAGGLVWTLVALAKTGSSSNYWMEPAMAAVVVISGAKKTRIHVFGTKPVPASVAAISAVWTGVASIRGAFEHGEAFRKDAAFVAAIREAHGVPKDSLIASDDAGIELRLNGRILTTTYQWVYLVAKGAVPAELWLSDISSPNVALYIERTGHLQQAPRLEQGLSNAFVLVESSRGFRVYKRRPD
jgi:hypothetical protein